MGTWGHRIFDDDFALDIREEYLAMILEGRSSEEATKALRGEGPLDSDEEPVFWISLAATQWEHGRLLPRVKKEALRVIDGGSDLARWEGNGPGAKKRTAELAKLRAQLLRAQPKPKKITRRMPKLAQGDVFRIPFGDQFAFGRVLTQNERAFYRFTTQDKQPPLDQIVAKEVAFVVGCTDDGFLKRRWRVLGNLPLEKKLTQPIRFFHQSVGSTTCDVFDIWEPGTTTTLPEAQCKDLEQWASYSEVHIVKRLRECLG